MYLVYVTLTANTLLFSGEQTARMLQGEDQWTTGSVRYRQPKQRGIQGLPFYKHAIFGHNSAKYVNFIIVSC